jgi:hypothetical protein
MHQENSEALSLACHFPRLRKPRAPIDEVQPVNAMGDVSSSLLFREETNHTATLYKLRNSEMDSQGRILNWMLQELKHSSVQMTQKQNERNWDLTK